jgi:hypothetical protein
MTCEQFDDIVELFIGAELDPASRAAAESHLAGCPACRERLEAARGRLGALEAALAARRASERFVERTMARVRAIAGSRAEEKPERLRSRLLRYAAMAAAGALIAIGVYGLFMGGYGVPRGAPAARLEGGLAALTGPAPRSLRPGAPLAVGDVLATRRDSGATLALAGGRLRLVLAPNTVVRITDPRSGSVVQLLQGDIRCHAASGAEPPVIVAPFARVVAGPGVVRLHIVPRPGSGPQQGAATIVIANDGDARVFTPEHPGGEVPLERGQALVLQPDLRIPIARPASVDRLQALTQMRLRDVRTRHGELELEWQAATAGMHQAPAEERSLFVRRALDIQNAIAQTQALHADLERQIEFLRRVQE